jgi:hypothetical protein
MLYDVILDANEGASVSRNKLGQKVSLVFFSGGVDLEEYNPPLRGMGRQNILLREFLR